MPEIVIAGQLNEAERRLIMETITQAAKKPLVVIEVGTWLGGGSTLHILRALEKNGCGHLWGIEADRQIYERMIANLKAGAPEALHRFTPLFGFSQQVIPQWLAEQPADLAVDFAFLDGGNNLMEQITEFRLIESRVPVGGQIMAHDANFRKAKFLVPFISRWDNWRTQIYDISNEGLLHAIKTAPQPSPASLKNARHRLLKSRLHPFDVAAAIMPSPLCGLICRLLPARAVLRLFAGAKPEGSE